MQPQIKMPEVLRPETDFNVTVSEKNGKPMTYTLAIVDDGLLDLTNFKTPDPWNDFYAREASGHPYMGYVRRCIGSFRRKLQFIVQHGWRRDIETGRCKSESFQTGSQIYRSFLSGKGKQQTHTLKLPMYVGSVRAMVVAGQDGAYGNAEKTASYGHH